MVEPPAVKPSGSGKLIGRIVLYSILAVALGIGGYEYMQKRSAMGAYATWDAQLEKAQDASEEIYIKDLSEVSGSPVVTKDDSGLNAVHTYTWKGLFREYPVEITLSPVSPILKKESPDMQGEIQSITLEGADAE